MPRRGCRCPFSPCRHDVSLYSRIQVEALLTALFNGGTLDQASSRPDPTMPSGSKPNPSRLNGLAVSLIDVERAWDAVAVDWFSRQAVYLHHGQGLTHGAIGQAQHVSTSTARRRVERGVGAVLAGCNGVAWFDDDDLAEDTQNVG